VGLLRLVLALIVCVAHIDPGTGLRPEFAVTCFFAMSGYYMQLVLATKYTPQQLGERWCIAFYVSRYLRLYPMYLVGLAGAFLSGEAARVPWSSPLGLASLIPNLTMIGLNIPSVTYVALPPAWSVGVEISLYALAPWMLRLPERQIGLLLLLGLALRMVPGGTHLPIGAGLDAFLIGAILYRRYGLLLPSSRGDRWLGDLSFPVYLLHLPILVILRTALDGWELMFAVVAATIAVSAGASRVEQRHLEPLRALIVQRVAVGWRGSPRKKPQIT
jgi:peptidoglycan/LPS O-acetylase OafA/YrhL